MRIAPLCHGKVFDRKRAARARTGPEDRPLLRGGGGSWCSPFRCGRTCKLRRNQLGRRREYHDAAEPPSKLLGLSQQNEKFLFQQSRKFLFETGKLTG